MKILIYGLNFEPELTGIGKYTGEMAHWLANGMHEVRVVTAPPYYPGWKVDKAYLRQPYRKQRKGNLFVFRCPLYVPAKPTGMKRILHLFSFALFSFPTMLAQIAWRPHAVLMIEPTLACAPAALLVSKLSKAHAMLHIQDFEVDAAFNLNIVKSQAIRKLVTSFEKWVMNRFDTVSTISNGMLKTLEAKGIQKDKSFQLPNWVDIQHIYPIHYDHSAAKLNANHFAKFFGFSEEDVVLLYSGNMGEKQGLDLIIHAAAALKSSPKYKFVMCGNGAACARLKEAAKNLCNVFWLDLQPIELLNQLLNFADIHLLPQQEGAADIVMPSKLTGIFASGKPVIATSTTGTSLYDTVTDRGIVVPPGDLSQFVAAIVSLASNPEQQIRLGYSARQFAEQNLSKDGILQKLEQHLLNKLSK